MITAYGEKKFWEDPLQINNGNCMNDNLSKISMPAGG